MQYLYMEDMSLTIYMSFLFMVMSMYAFMQ